MVKNPPANAGDVRDRSRKRQETWVQSLSQDDPLEGGHGNPLQYSCLGGGVTNEIFHMVKIVSQHSALFSVLGIALVQPRNIC